MITKSMSNLVNGYAMGDAAKTQRNLLFSSQTTNTCWITTERKTENIPQLYERNIICTRTQCRQLLWFALIA